MQIRDRVNSFAGGFNRSLPNTLSRGINANTNHQFCHAPRFTLLVSTRDEDHQCAGTQHRHIQRAAVVIKPSTLLRFHQLLKQRKYRLLYSSRRNGKPGPKGPSKELVAAIVELKRRNPSFGCPRIAQQINLDFGIHIDKDVVRRVLAAQFPSDSGNGGPSWLTFLGHTKDCLWSVDLFRCESILLKSHWVLVVMDQFTRRIIIGEDSLLKTG